MLQDAAGTEDKRLEGTDEHPRESRGCPGGTCKHKSVSIQGLTCGKQQQSIFLVLQLQVPVPVSRATSKCLFPPSEGWGLGAELKDGVPKSQEASTTRAQQPVTPHSQMGGGQGLGFKGHLPIWSDSITIHLSMPYLLGSWPQKGSGGRPSDSGVFRCAGVTQPLLTSLLPPF